MSGVRIGTAETSADLILNTETQLFKLSHVPVTRNLTAETDLRPVAGSYKVSSMNIL